MRFRAYIRETRSLCRHHSFSITLIQFVRKKKKKKMATRQSKRLRLEPPEIEELNFTCFVCRAPSETCANNVVRMPCCQQFVHKTCAEQWDSNHDRCGLCRGSRTSTVIVPSPVNAVQNREILTRQQVLDRLQRLLNSDELQQQLDRVS